MAKIIVDQFEVIEIDHNAGEFAAVLARGFEQSLEILGKGAAVQAAGERIAGRQIS